MSGSRKKPAWGAMSFFGIALLLATYFTFAAVQGDFGLFRRIEVQAEAGKLTEQRDALKLELADIQNKTRRLSDEYLDLDLLDEQARKTLGMLRTDEIVIR